MKENYELIDNEERHQYEFHIERYVPRIEYIKNKDGVIYLEKKDLRLVPLCPFVAGYIQKHPDWKRIVMRGIHV